MRVAYRIETARLVIRSFRPEDALLRKEAADANLPGLVREPARWPKAGQPLEDHLAHARKRRGTFDLDQDHNYAIFDASERRFLGEVGLLTRAGPGAREIGYWVRADAVRTGIASEAVAALVTVAFEQLGVDRVDIRCAVDNAASAGVARKVGFVYEGTLRQRRHRPEEAAEDDLAFSMIRADFAARPNADAVVRAFDITGAQL